MTRMGKWRGTSMAKKAKAVAERKGAGDEIERRCEANRLAWARRHPRQASEERQLRKTRVETIARWKHKNEGTPETHEQHRRRSDGALARLYQSGAIDADQLASAVEIAAIVSLIGSDVQVKTASLETRVDVTRIGDSGFFERLGQVRREIAYTGWRAALGMRAAAVLEMIAGDEGYASVAARHGMGARRAKALLLAALDLWPDAVRSAARSVDERDLAAAHARLLG